MTDLQLRIMRVLWTREETTAADVQAALKPEHDLATTTVSTLLSRLVKRGQVGMRRAGRQFYYYAVAGEREVSAARMSELTDALFSGSAAAAVNQLLDARSVTRDDLEDLKRIIAAKEAELEGRSNA